LVGAFKRANPKIQKSVNSNRAHREQLRRQRALGAAVFHSRIAVHTKTSGHEGSPSRIAVHTKTKTQVTKVTTMATAKRIHASKPGPGSIPDFMW
jgi:hypothetical protein